MIITSGTYELIPWNRNELSVRLQSLLQDLKQGLVVTENALNFALSSPLTECIFIVDSEADVLVGYAELLEWRSATGVAGYVENVVVSVAEQGKAYGTQLVEQLKIEARKRCLKTIWLHTGAWRTSAQNLYKKHGFMQKDTCVLYLDLEGTP